MTLRKVRLELARCRDFPQGSAHRGYEFVAPLTPEGTLDAQAWPKLRDRCTVRRFWPGEDDETGHIVHARGHDWAFRYDGAPEESEEPIFNFDRHQVVEGEYVSITEHDGIQRTFRIVSVR